MRPGLAVLAGIAAAALAIFFLDEAERAAQEGPRLVVLTEAAPELEPGSTVWVAGRPAGRVLSVRFRNPTPGGKENVVIEAVLRRGAASVVRQDAKARIVSSSLLAPMVLSIRPGSPERPPFDFRDTLRSTVSLIDQDRALALMDTLRRTAEAARPLARRLAGEARSGSGTLAALRRDELTLPRLEERLERLQSLLAPEGEGSLARFLADTALALGLERTTASLRRWSATLDSVRTAGTDAAEIAAVLERLEGRLAEMQSRAAQGYGTLGRTLHDPAILEQVELLQARLAAARSEVLANPFRYLRVRLF
ncbi:MAG: MlaD family protein [Gemmatimonadota bacterium]